MATRLDYQRLIRLKGYDGASAAQLNDAIEEARRRLNQDHRWESRETLNTVLVTTPGSDSVSLAPIADLAHLDAVRPLSTDGVNGGSHFLDYQQLRAQQADEPADGLPQYWTRLAGKIVLYPTPDQAYHLNVDYVAKLAPLASDADVDVFPDELQDLVAWGAVPTLAFRQRDAWAAAGAENQYQTLLRAAVSQENMRQRQSSRQVRSGYWGPPR